MRRPAPLPLPIRVLLLVLTGISSAGGPTSRALGATPLDLRAGWRIQSSAVVRASGDLLSQPGYDTTGWHAASVPTTVVAALVADGTFPDPHYGMNLRQIPGATYPVGSNFSNQPMPADSPFAVPWWYRTEFGLPAEVRGRTIWLRFGGINFAANVWLNGRQLTDAAATAGTFRVHELDVTSAARPGEPNALAIEVFSPTPSDLALTFVDWNPMPPDKAMGLFRPVTLTTSGPVALRHPMIASKLDPPALDRAELTVRVFARNATQQAVKATATGTIGKITFSQDVTLGPEETREIVFSPSEFPQLVVASPKLWWPHQYGEPTLHDLELEIRVGASVSDRLTSRFGIREVSGGIDENGHFLVQINGRNILIRGAGWTPEMTLRYSRERYEQELRYVKDMGLNTVRLEGKLEDDAFFDIADREGLLVMPGWCCCHYWERWGEWTGKDLPIAVASLRDQILRLRGHASVFVWLNGSDNPPPAAVEKAYLEAVKELSFPNPVLSSATSKVAEHSGPSGVKMLGPYEWVPPIYWYTDREHGGPFGFATEIGPGPAPPPLDSLRRFIPEDALWPPGEVWEYHCGGGKFKDLDVFDAAMAARYGEAESVEEYARKAQVAAYESHRAMFESFGARKYTATGIIQWMLNNAWPGMIWHLYDFDLRPGGSYFGTKKACEPVHVQYSYDDRSIVVVNSTLAELRGLTVTARVVGLDGREVFSRTESVDAAPDGTRKVFALPAAASRSPTYFVSLRLSDRAGKVRSRNDYWLSTTTETLAWDRSTWYYTPVSEYADLTALATLPTAELTAIARFETGEGEGRARVVLANPSAVVAFFVRLAVRKGAAGEEILPVLWEDNYVTLMPGERREVGATWASSDAAGATPVVAVDGWNVAPRFAAAEER